MHSQPNCPAGSLTDLIAYAVLAPSSHNTQPWRFALAERQISLFADRSRALPVNDPADRELVISCGCALLNLRVAAAAAGFIADTVRLPEPKANDLLARINLVPAQANPNDAGLSSAILGRRTYRQRFAARPVPDDRRRELIAAAEAEGAWLTLLDDSSDREAIAAMVATGDTHLWADPSWRHELAAWLRSRRRDEGLPVPGFAATLARLLVRKINLGKRVAAGNWQLTAHAPILVALSTDGDGVQDWLQAGEALQRVLLAAYNGGLQASYLNQPIQVAALRPKLQYLIDPSGFPQILLRIGYPLKTLPKSPRRRLEDVLL